MDLHPGASQRCWNCQGRLALPPRLRFKQEELVLTKHAELYQHHVDGSSTADFTLAGKVVVDPARPNWWGLKNLSSAPWRARVRRRGVDETITVRPQEAIRITKNVKLYFPGASAVVEA